MVAFDDRKHLNQVARFSRFFKCGSPSPEPQPPNFALHLLATKPSAPVQPDQPASADRCGRPESPPGASAHRPSERSHPEFLQFPERKVPTFQNFQTFPKSSIANWSMASKSFALKSRRKLSTHEPGQPVVAETDSLRYAPKPNSVHRSVSANVLAGFSHFLPTLLNCSQSSGCSPRQTHRSHNSIILSATNVFCTSLCKREARHFKPIAAGRYTAYQEWVPYRSPFSMMPSPSTETSFSAVWREQLFPFFTAVTVQRESPDRSAFSVTESPLRTCSTLNMILSILIFKFLRSLAFANFIIDKAKAKAK